MSEPLKVVVAEDHEPTRAGFCAAVRSDPGLELVGAVEDGQRALDLLRASRPDVALMDMRMPKLKGLEVLAHLREDPSTSELPVLFVSAFPEPVIVRDALSRGAAGFASKHTTAEELCRLLRGAATGQVVVSADLQAGLSALLGDGAARRDLTDRQIEVLTAMATGLRAPQIAAALTVEASTVHAHQKAIYEKLGVSDRAAAVAEGMRRGLIS